MGCPVAARYIPALRLTDGYGFGYIGHKNGSQGSALGAVSPGSGGGI